MASKNILVMLHGMTSDPDPSTHADDYDHLWAGLIRREGSLEQIIVETIRVEWGHEPPGLATSALRPDQMITRAEAFIRERLTYEAVQADGSPANHLLAGGAELFSQWVTRHLTTPIKEMVLLLGFTDALYYCSPAGEQAIRNTVYTQFLQGLEAYRAEDEVRLHVIAHSLGVTVAFDFLFGLFAPDSAYTNGVPDFVTENQGLPAAVEAYSFWRQRAQQGSLIMASKSSTGGQLPLMMMRKQKLVNMLATRELLDPRVISIPQDGPPRWKIFYDVDDVLGYPTRRLFQAGASIEEYQVNTGWRPDLAHSQYWENDKVLTEIAGLIEQNSR